LLRDIKPNEVIPDFSIYFFVGLILISLIILFFIVKYIYKKFKNKIIMLSYEDPKQFAYEVTPYLKNIEEFELINRLDKYKYRKNVSNIDEDLLKEIKEVFITKGIKVEF
jgi:hypothetical protein